MPLEFHEDRAMFIENVAVDEAERLHEWLVQQSASSARASADLGACTHLHPANLQVLMAFETRVVTWPADPDLRVWLQTALHPCT